MKLIACISWFYESPAWLAATVASAARICDHVVAVDGRYALFTHDMAFSPVAEAETIMEAAEGAGIALTLHRPTQPFWGNEVEKRNLLFSLAKCHATEMEDWFIVLDGDTYIVEHSPMVREELERTDALCANYAAEEYMDPHNPEMPMAVARMQDLPSVTRTSITCMYRVIPDLAYEGTHYSISGTIGGEKVWVWGHPQAADPLDLSQFLVVRHRNQLRTDERRRQAAAYYEDREKFGIEVHPG